MPSAVLRQVRVRSSDRHHGDADTFSVTRPISQQIHPCVFGCWDPSCADFNGQSRQEALDIFSDDSVADHLDEILERLLVFRGLFTVPRCPFTVHLALEEPHVNLGE